MKMSWLDEFVADINTVVENDLTLKGRVMKATLHYLCVGILRSLVISHEPGRERAEI
jgi:hypothetical protein